MSEMQTAAAVGPIAVRGVFSVPLTLRSWTIGLLVLNAVLDLASVIPSWATLGVLARVGAGEPVDQGTASMIDGSAAVIGLANLAAYLAAAVVFCCWFYRVNANARLLTDEKPPASPGMAVAGFFIPILCLYYPYRAARFSWKASARAAFPEGGGPGDGIVGAWWTAWVISNIIGQLVFKQAMRSAFGGEEPRIEQLEFQEYGSILLSIGSVVTAAACIWMVKGFTGLQARIASRAMAPAAV